MKNCSLSFLERKNKHAPSVPDTTSFVGLPLTDVNQSRLTLSSRGRSTHWVTTTDAILLLLPSEAVTSWSHVRICDLKTIVIVSFALLYSPYEKNWDSFWTSIAGALVTNAWRIFYIWRKYIFYLTTIISSVGFYLTSGVPLIQFVIKISEINYIFNTLIRVINWNVSSIFILFILLSTT